MTASDLRRRAYMSTRRLLRRLRLQRWLDVYACQIVAAPTAARGAPSEWAREELWMDEVGPGSADWLTGAHPARAAIMDQRWAAGYRCFAATTQPSTGCSAYLWAAVGPIRFYSRSLGRNWQVPAGVAWLFDAWAHPLSLGTYPDLNRFAVARLRAEGVGWTWGQVEAGNRASRRLTRRWGAEAVGPAVSLRLGRLTLCAASPRLSLMAGGTGSGPRLAVSRMTHIT